MSGLLAHFAAGVFILLLKPFKVGDLIDAGGTLGNVVEIGPFVTKINTLDNVLTMIGTTKSSPAISRTSPQTPSVAWTLSICSTMMSI